MSSVTRFIKQIPTDSAYFAVLGLTATYQYTPNANPTVVVDADFSGAAIADISSGVLRDMGQFYVTQDTGRMFRRVQILNLASSSTEGVVGVAASTGVDNGYQVCYIEMPQKASLGLPNGSAPTTVVARFG
jgi:hypothetical protein